MSKTVDLEFLVAMANNVLRESTLDSSFREGVCTIIETALMEAGRYAGFRYLTQDEVPLGHAPGIYVDRQGAPFRSGNKDETRRQYSMKAASSHEESKIDG